MAAKADTRPAVGCCSRDTRRSRTWVHRAQVRPMRRWRGPSRRSSRRKEGEEEEGEEEEEEEVWMT